MRSFFTSAVAGSAMLGMVSAGHADEITFIEPSISAGEASAIFQLHDDEGNVVVLEKARPPFLYDMTDMAVACRDLLKENGPEIAREQLLYFLDKHFPDKYGNSLDESIFRAAKKGIEACHSPSLS